MQQRSLCQHSFEKYNFESQKNNLKMCHGILLRRQDSSNSWAEKMEAEVLNTQKKITNSTLNLGLSQTNPSIQMKTYF